MPTVNERSTSREGLLDENLDHSLRKHLSGHDVVTVSFMGWAGLKNGELLRAAEDSGIEVLVTGDRTLSYEQNLTGRGVAIVALSAIRLPISSRKRNTGQ